MSSGPERAIFVNRTLNMRSIDAIGYDMDYTLVHYDAAAWEERAFHHAKARLERKGWPVGDFAFDARAVIRGLAIDLEEGNLVKATRFGYVIRASHGTRPLGFDELRSTYASTLVDLSEDRFQFVNVLFSLSEASLFAQLVDAHDGGASVRGTTYGDLYAAVRDALSRAHTDSDLKREIVANPDRFVVQEPETTLALLDQLHAGKRLMLITNADWDYTQEMMSYAIDAFVPDGTWRDLFETVIVSADKPTFFTSNSPLYKVVDEEQSLLSPHFGKIEPGSVFFGGCARRVESSMDVSGDRILYVGDHLFGDVHFSKAHLRWRTALILRELESEVAAAMAFRPQEHELTQLMAEKSRLEASVASLRLARQRVRQGYGPTSDAAPSQEDVDVVRTELAELDESIAPLAKAAGQVRNLAWGPLMRAGLDKSLFARQVERYADIYTSRVSNLAEHGPFALLRAGKIDLPHDAVIDETPHG